jgi:CRISPR-associated endoribonuclease Cas6
MWRFISLTVLRAEYRVGRDGALPEYLGSTLRGVFGHALRAVSCAEPDSPCASCPRIDRCAAGAMFDSSGGEGSAARNAGDGAGGFDRPRPYVLDVPPRRSAAYSAGESIRLGVTLVGRARIWSPWVIAALDGIGRLGLGVERQPVSLVRLTAIGPAGTELELDPRSHGIGARIPELSGAAIVAEGPAPADQAIIVLTTPADLQQKGRRLDRLDGPAFFRRLIRRVGTLAETYGSPPPGAPTCDYHALAELADRVEVVDQEISTQTWERYSNRREAKHPLCGLVGRALFAGIAEPLWPYLVLGQWVHQGKGASFGQGRYAVLSPTDRLPPTPR